jgi:hypothetical protein
MVAGFGVRGGVVSVGVYVLCSCCLVCWWLGVAVVVVSVARCGVHVTRCTLRGARVAYSCGAYVLLMYVA